MSLDSYIHKKKIGAPGAPILFAFHGTGGDESQFFDFAARLIPQATIVSPRGDVTEGGALRFFRRREEGVYDMEDLDKRKRAMAAFVEAQARDAQAGMTIGLGYSNGANILAATMFDDDIPFDAVVLMHPLIPWTPAPNPLLAGRDVLITAGRRDPICPPDRTEALARYFEEQGSALELEWHDGGHDIRQNEIAALQRFVSRFATA